MQQILTYFFLVVYSVTIIGIILIIITDNRNPLKTLPWIVVLVLAPVVGLVFYFFFGQNLSKQRIISRRTRKRITMQLEEPEHPEGPGIPPRYRPLASLLLNTLVNNVLLKNLVARTRPYEVVDGLHRIIEAQSDYSFPSGHTGSAFAVAVVVFLMCPRKIGVPVLAFAFVIAFSRLYVGVHFPTDVLGGALIGAVIAYLVCAVYRRKTGQKGSIWNFER